MSTAPATETPVPLSVTQRDFLLRRLHSLTGLIFGGYLVVHLLVNATIAQLGETYQIQVRKIHELPLLYLIEWTFIFMPIIFHTLYGIWITVTGKPNVNNYGYFKNWMYFLQRLSAIVIVLFLVFHVLSLKYGLFGESLKFHANYAAYTLNRHLNVSAIITWIVYPLGITASCFHLANGLWTAAITWGLTISAAAQRRWGGVCLLVFVLTMVLGFVALFWGTLGDPTLRGPVMEMQETLLGMIGSWRI